MKTIFNIQVEKIAVSLIALAVAGSFILDAGIKDPVIISETVTNQSAAKTGKREPLTSYVEGIHDLYVEQNAVDLNWFRDITYDQKKVKEIRADDKKVDLANCGRYRLTYTIVGLSTERKKTIRVTVVDSATAQTLANAGEAVWQSGSTVKLAEASATNEVAVADRNETSHPVHNAETSAAAAGTAVTAWQGESTGTYSGSEWTEPYTEPEVPEAPAPEPPAPEPAAPEPTQSAADEAPVADIGQGEGGASDDAASGTEVTQ